MKLTTILLTLFVTLSLSVICSCRAQTSQSDVQKAAIDCSQAKATLTLLEHKNPAVIHRAIKMSTCYQGGMADSFDVALGSLMTTYPHKVLSAMHEAQLPNVVIEDIAHSTPWQDVDHPCRLSESLKKRLSSIKHVRGFDKERNTAMKAITRIGPKIVQYCAEKMHQTGLDM